MLCNGKNLRRRMKKDHWFLLIAWILLFCCLRCEWKGKCCVVCGCTYTEVPGRPSDLSTLLTIKFPIFLSRLNEISERCQKILPVSLSFCSNLNIFKMTVLAARLCGWKVSVNGILLFFSFCDVWSADCRSNERNTEKRSSTILHINHTPPTIPWFALKRG